MAKSKKDSKAEQVTPKPASAAHTGAFDPTLAALFASSSGPVTAPPKPARTYDTTTQLAAKTSGVSKQQKQDDTSSDSESNAESVGEEESEESGESSSESESETEVEDINERPRKRRRVDADEGLESRYLNKLVREEEQEQKQRSKKEGNDTAEDLGEEQEQDASDSDINSDLADLTDDEADVAQKKKKAAIADLDDDAIPKHESVAGTAHEVEAAKTKRTCFLGNVATAVIKSKSAKKTLILHIRSALAEKHHEKIESIRFRSTAFVSDAGPKRAAYAKKELMDETMKSTNAYVVLNTEAAARKVGRLNGTIVLDRHLRVDNLANPARQDHKRCVFVGNLSFVDEATPTDETEEAEKKRKRTKEPADAEEGLWQTFGKCGKVESVRVVRDKETRISKGFAYVQFMDENAVESALLMNEKKFPPMLPRTLRVSRAKREMKREKKMDNSARNGQRRDAKGKERSERAGRQSTGRPDAPDGQRDKVVLEGHRANSNSMPKGMKKLKKRPAVKPTDRGSKRAAAFRAGGGRKKRDMAS